MSNELAGDEHMGAWVYCDQHLRPHRTGWCTVGERNKIALKAQDEKSAYDEVRAMDLKIYGETKNTRR